MSPDYFARLDAELAARTRAGAHVATPRRRLGHAARRATGAAVLAVALAATLISEFPASARGQAQVRPAHVIVREA